MRRLFPMYLSVLSILIGALFIFSPVQAEVTVDWKLPTKVNRTIYLKTSPDISVKVEAEIKGTPAGVPTGAHVKCKDCEAAYFNLKYKNVYSKHDPTLKFEAKKWFEGTSQDHTKEVTKTVTLVAEGGKYEGGAPTTYEAGTQSLTFTVFGPNYTVVQTKDCKCNLEISDGSSCEIKGEHTFKAGEDISLGVFVGLVDASASCTTVSDFTTSLTAAGAPHNDSKKLPGDCALSHESNFPPGYEYKMSCGVLPPAVAPASPSGGGSSGSTGDKPTASSYELDTADYKMPADYKGPLPPCAFDGSCRDVNKLLELFINFGQLMLGIIGSFALVFFVYGGFMMILSMGNAERVKKGRDILVAAVVGIIIAFSAYALIDFVLDALQVSSSFRVINS